MKYTTIETSRYRLYPITEADTEVLRQLWIRPRVRRYLWDDRVISEVETAAIVEENARLFREHGFGLWGVRDLCGERLIGTAGYWYFREPPELELVLAVVPEYWGRGLATEVGQALIRFGFEELEFSEICASTDAPNSAAVRVMEKLRMGFVRRAVVDGIDTMFYGLSRNSWRPEEII